MTDRELLELAAKAAGMLDGEHDWKHGILRRYLPTGPEYWNPLADDGDALRLAVKLRMRIDIGEFAVHVGTAGDEGEDLAAEAWHKNGPTCEEATRRAIVRAAAAMAQPAP